MTWFSETEEAENQLKICEDNNCGDCDKCVWIKMSREAMETDGKVNEGDPHPLFQHMMKLFNGKEM
mgnify:CR=1 FL=1